MRRSISDDFPTVGGRDWQIVASPYGYRQFPAASKGSLEADPFETVCTDGERNLPVLGRRTSEVRRR